MDKKEAFKTFVKKNPRLLKYVRSGDMTWQKFYEIYDLYDEKEEVWQEYLQTEEAKPVPKETKEPMDLMSWLKSIDLDSVQNGVSSLQRVVGLLGELATPETKTPTETYKPRPLYKHFED